MLAVLSFCILKGNVIHKEVIALCVIVKNNRFLQETTEKTVVDVMNCTSKLI